MVGRSGVLVLSAWTDGDDLCSLRARLFAASATVDGEQRVTWAAAGLNEIADQVRLWLQSLIPPTGTVDDDRVP
jgi:hypothetical protein